MIKSGVCNGPVLDQPYTATVVLNSDSRLYGLVIDNTCADPTSAAVAVLSLIGPYYQAYLDNVEMKATGTANACIGLHSAGDLEVRDSFAFATCSGGGTDYGFVIDATDPPGYVILTDCKALIWAGGAAVWIGDTTGGTVIVRGANATAVTAGPALRVDGGEVLVTGSRLEGVTSISTTGGATATITNSSFAGTIAIDGSGTRVQLDGVTPDPLSIFASANGMNVTGGAVVGATSSRFGTVTVGPGTVYLGASQIQHVVVGTGGSATCAGVFSWGWTFYPSSCP
jgi:hypothetical protein